MQADATARGPAAELADVRRAMNGEVAVVEDRIGHRRVAVDARSMIAVKRLWPERPARRAADAGRDRPGVALLAVNDHGHALARLVDPDDDVGPGAIGHWDRHDEDRDRCRG